MVILAEIATDELSVRVLNLNVTNAYLIWGVVAQLLSALGSRQSSNGL